MSYHSLKYSQLLKLPAIGSGLVPDGYCGHMAEVIWRFHADSGKTLVQHSMGFHGSALPPATDETEARWLLENHPNAREWIVRPYGVKSRRIEN